MGEILKNARFITTENSSDSVSPVFRGEFAVQKQVEKAELTVTAQGLYEACINGKRVGQFVFAPGWTDYKSRLQVQTYDVSEHILLGDNKIDILLGNGWYKGAIGRGMYDALGDRAVIASLCIVYNDGTVDEISTDSTWKYSKTGILYSDLYNGETYDANVKYGDWKNAVEVKGNRETLVAQEGEEVREHEPIPALSLIITPKGERVIDFGQEITGYVEFRTVGSIGDRITIEHAEVLDREGNFYNANYREAKSRVTYITDGNKENWYHPIFSFQGFRYIKLTEYPTEDIYLWDFRAIPVYSNMKRTGYFSCSDDLVNRLYQNIIWGQRDNFLDVPTDCPQRDERLGWTGDAQIFCRTAAYNYNVEKFFRKWLRDLASEQGDNGAVTEIVPRIWGPKEIRHGSFAWGDAATVCPWELYRAYGDKSILAEQFDSMKGWVDFIISKGKTPDDWASGPQYGDWLGLDAEEGSYYGATSNALLAAVFAIYSTDILIKTCEVLGKDPSEYKAFKEKATSAFKENFIGEDGMLTSDTQTAYICALYFGLAPDREKYAKHLADKIHENGNRIQTGFIGTPYIMNALSENGYTELAYTLLFQTEYPSWLYSVRKGATTVWEHWDSLKPDGSMWSDDMNSFNHYAYGAVAAWLYGTVLGINPDESKPGYEHIIICPQVDSRLDYARGSVETRFGVVRTEWRKEGNGYILEIDVPEKTTADVSFGDIRETVTAGHYSFAFGV